MVSLERIQVRIGEFRYGITPVLNNTYLDFDRPQLVALIGPNGSGKSTLLRILAGHLYGDTAYASLGDKPIHRLHPRELSRMIAWVPQRSETCFSMTVREMLRIGRYRLQRPLRPPPDGEDAAIEWVLSKVGIQHLLNREVESLSGGEWQRALIARALVQDTPTILLDEPVASLDLRYQEEIYSVLRGIADAGRLVIAADHHIELASAHADRLLVLAGGTLVADAPPDTVLTPETLERVFGVQVEVFRDPVSGTPRLSRPR